MARTSSIFFKSNVYPACDALIGQGIRPTIGSVRSQMGVNNGSNSTLQALINEWYHQTRDTEVSKLDEGISLESDLPVELIELTRRFYDGLTHKAKTHVEEYKSVLHKDRDWIHQQLREIAEVRSMFEQEQERLIDSLQHKERLLKDAYDDIKRLEHQTAEQHAQIRILNEKLASETHRNSNEISRLRERVLELEDRLSVSESFRRMQSQQQKSLERQLFHGLNDMRKIADRLILTSDNDTTPEGADELTGGITLILEHINRLSENYNLMSESIDMSKS